MKFDDRFRADMFYSKAGLIFAGLEDLGVHMAFKWYLEVHVFLKARSSSLVVLIEDWRSMP